MRRCFLFAQSTRTNPMKSETLPKKGRWPKRLSALPFGENGMGKGKRKMRGVVRTQPGPFGRVTARVICALENERAEPLALSIKQTMR